MFGRVRLQYNPLAGIASAAGGPVGLAVSGGLQMVTALSQGLRSLKLNRQADDMERNTTRPTYRIQQGFLDNQALAESRAGQGLSDTALQVYSDNANRGLNLGVDSILRGGGDIGAIADLYDTSEDNYMKVALLEEEARLKNMSVYMATNEATAAEQDKEWQINTYNPYMDRVAAIDRLRNRASATGDAARNLALGAVNNFVTGNLLRGNMTMPQGQQAVAGPAVTAPVNPVSFQPTYNNAMPTNAGYQPMLPNSPNQPAPAPTYGDYFRNMLRKQ